MCCLTTRLRGEEILDSAGIVRRLDLSVQIALHDEPEHQGEHRAPNKHRVGVRPQATDVRPAPADDPRGAGLAASVFPLIITSIAAAVALTVRVESPLWRLEGAAAFAAAGGLAAAGIIQGWFGSIDGDVIANAGVFATTLLAMTLALIGLDAAFGRLGLGPGAATMILLGNPLAGMTTAPELLPEPWGDLGQLLPPGAGGTALRSVAFFDGAGSADAWTALLTWVAAALVLVGAAALRDHRHRVNPETQ